MENTKPTTSQSVVRPWPFTVFGIIGVTIAAVATLGVVWLLSANQIVITPALLAPFAGLFVALGLRLASGIGMLLMRRWLLPVFITTVVLSGLSALSALAAGLGAALAIFTFLVELGILWYIWQNKALLR